MPNTPEKWQPSLYLFKMTKFIDVKFLKVHPGYAYFTGNEGIIDVRKAFKMVWDGYVTIQFVKTLKRILRAIIGWLVKSKKK